MRTTRTSRILGTMAIGAFAFTGVAVVGPTAPTASAKPSCQDNKSTDIEAQDVANKGAGKGRGAAAWNAGLALGGLASEVSNSAEIIQCAVGVYAKEYPDYNIMFIQQETYGGPEFINGVEERGTITVGTNVFDIWVFDTGQFTNDGDLGYANWCWDGDDWTRSDAQDRTVTFR